MTATDPTIYSWWRWMPINPGNRPDYNTPESEKDEKYHRECWRFYLGRTQSIYMDWYGTTASINAAFANEQLWGMPEDKEMFLMDKGQTTGRRALKSPLIRPMVTRLIGQLSQVSIQARVTAQTQRAKTRKEDQKKMAVLLARAAQAGSEMERAMKQSVGISPDEGQAKTAVDETYQDMLIPPVNSMLTMASEDSDLEGQKLFHGTNLAVSGMCGAMAVVRGSKFIWKPLSYDTLFWDANADKWDMSDGEYVGCCPLQNIASLCEQYQPKAEKIKALDQLAKQGSTGNYNTRVGWGNGATAPRVYSLFWRDQKYVTRGFVEGPSGPMMVNIGEVNPDTGVPDYTTADVIPPPRNIYTANWTGDTHRTVIQVVRYCVGIPYEMLPSGNGEKPEPGKGEDLIFEWGMYPLQEADPDHIDEVKFPIKLSAWSYLNGYVVAPVTAAVSPQRVQNQVLSDITWRMSKAKSSMRFIDKNSITSGGMTVKQALYNMKEGDDVVLNATAIGGVQNAVREVAGGLGSDFFGMWDLIARLRQLAEDSTGMYAENYGEPGSANKLVGVQQLQLQQSSIMQRPYYDAIQRLYKQMHQFTAQAGRQFYIRHPWVLEDMVGTDGLSAIMQSKDMELEQFRVAVDLSLDSAQVKEGTDALIMSLLNNPVPMLDPVAAGDLLGESYPTDVYARVRTSTKEMKAAQIQAAQAQAQAAEAQSIGAQEAMLAQQESDLYNNALNASLKVDQIQQKADMPVISAQAENLKPEALQPQGV